MTQDHQLPALRAPPRDALPTGRGDDGPTLTDRMPGRCVMAETLRVQAAARPCSALGRLLGRSPLSAEAAPWFSGAIGERRVGALLSRLERSGGWHVLHAVPVGTRGSDIDHVVIGPCSVVTINTKHHPGQRVWVGARTVMVAGSRKPYVRSSDHEAQRAASLLTAALGRPVPVEAAVVVVGASHLTVKEQPADVTVIGSGQLVRWLQRRPAVLGAAAVSALAVTAARPPTWQRRPEPGGTDPAPAFEPLAADVVSAARRRVVVVLVAFSGAVAGIAAVSGPLLASLG